MALHRPNFEEHENVQDPSKTRSISNETCSLRISEAFILERRETPAKDILKHDLSSKVNTQLVSSTC